MIRILTFCFLLNIPVFVDAQLNEENTIKAVITQLFDGMRAGDSMMLKPLFIDNALISSVFRDQNGQTIKRSNLASAFITTVGSPHEGIFDEKIWSYKINIDDPIAYAWTEYSFYLGKTLSHCGVNMFELLKVNNQWKISSITDTRRKNNCYTAENVAIHQLMDKWHKAASTADEKVFFGAMSDDAIYIGTDPKERWNKAEMIALLGKYFVGETAWSFTPISRNVEVGSSGQIAWLDELLNTWMGNCRGSAVLKKVGDEWKITHYHLAVAVDNDKIDGYLELIGKPRKKATTTEPKK